MPIGYIVGKQYRIDTNYDRYANLDVFKRLCREASKRGFGCFVSFSHMTRGYICEIRQWQEPFKHSTTSHRYYHNLGHKYAPTPLEATVLALAQCCPPDPLMLVLYLEANAVLLGMECADRRAQEKRLEKALDDLAALLPKVFEHAAFLEGTAFRELLIDKVTAMADLPYEAFVPGVGPTDEDWHGDIPLGQAKPPRPLRPDDDL